MQEEILDDYLLPEPAPVTETAASKFGRGVFLVSLAIGTILLLLGIISVKSNESFIDGVFTLGFIYLIGAFFFNLVIFIVLLIVGKTQSEKHVNRKSARQLLWNIPVAIIYFIILINIG